MTHKLIAICSLCVGPVQRPSADWIADSMHWRGRVLEGRHGHWCYEWDGLPVDETCDEWPCDCDVGRPHRDAMPVVVRRDNVTGVIR